MVPHVRIGPRAKVSSKSMYGRLVSRGIDPLSNRRARKAQAWVREDFVEYERQRLASSNPDEFALGDWFPITSDRHSMAGSATGHYFHQDLVVAREIFRRDPTRHIDVGSRIDGFVAHVATFRTIDVVDIRPLQSSVDGINFIQHDLMNLGDSMFESTDSLSCLHALEHFGLGRYGDPVDYSAWRSGLSALTSMLIPGGTLYLSVPTGEPQRVEFNAHRVFSMRSLRKELAESFDIERVAFVHDSGDLSADVDPFSPQADSSFGARYGCSIWMLSKK